MIRLFRVSIPVSEVVLVLSDTILLLACYVVAAFYALNSALDPWFYFRYDNGWIQILLVVTIIQAGLYFMDLYNDPGLRISRILLVQQLCVLLGISFLVQALIGYGKATLLQLPQWTMIYGSVLVLFLIPAWRFAFFALVRKALPRKKLLFVGASSAGKEIIACLKEKPNMGFEVLGYLGEAADFSDAPFLGPFTDLQPVMQVHRADLVVVSAGEPHSLPVEVLLSLKRSGAKVEDASALYEAVFGRIALRELSPTAMIVPTQLNARFWVSKIQSLYSFLLGLIGLLIALPVMVIVFLLVKITSPGPVFYSQKRVGLYGKVFSLYKFRSMYIDAEARSGPVWATKNDPRITPLGRWLRLLRLDELPQFFNVLRGEMAIAGPRPERPEFCAILEEKIPFYGQRHFVKPGITGWAQINHKYTETIEDSTIKLEYDLYYVKHLAPALDAYIIFHTLKVMLLFRGAQ